MLRKLLFLELNEVNFEYIAGYCARGSLPNFADLIKRHGWVRTSSEQRYEDLEPWIQWVTAHTGKTLSEHKVFRLGDIVKHDLPQIWEQLEERGLRVGAISPMNAKHRLRRPAFFVPDPWTPTKLTAGARLRGLYEAVAQAVNDNAQSRVTLRSAWQLLAGLCAYAAPANYASYVQLAATSRSCPWRKAIFLDLLFADVFVRETRRAAPDFATLFLNAAAHIQHHYLFSSACYDGSRRNPDWYVPSGRDPVHEVYAVYDRIIGRVRTTFPDSRIMIATGLHQDPHDDVTFYWRLRNHEQFLRRIGVPFRQVSARMSRDFLVECSSEQEAAAAERRMRMSQASDGLPLFEIDNRGSDLFVMLTYPKDIPSDFVLHVDQDRYAGLAADVAFVALKNGQHNGIGYFLDTGSGAELPRTADFPLAELPGRIAAALQRSLQADSAQRAAIEQLDERLRREPEQQAQYGIDVAPR